MSSYQGRERETLIPVLTPREAGFDRTYISLIERGVRSPTIRAIVKLAGVLEIRPSEIIQRMEARLSGEAES